VRDGPLPSDWPDWAADRQARARHSRAAILDCFHQLLQSTAFEDIAIEQLASASGMSIGAVYARFPSKASILQLLALLILQDMENRVRDSLAALAFDSLISDVANAYVRVLVARLIEHRNIIRQLRTTAPADPRLTQLIEAGNRRIHAAVRQRVREAAASSQIQIDEERLGVALLTVNASAREILIAGSAGTYGLSTEPDAVARYLGRAFAVQLV
jgi:AcrR family transcriptional regulator